MGGVLSQTEDFTLVCRIDLVRFTVVGEGDAVWAGERSGCSVFLGFNMLSEKKGKKRSIRMSRT